MKYRRFVSFGIQIPKLKILAHRMLRSKHTGAFWRPIIYADNIISNGEQKIIFFYLKKSIYINYETPLFREFCNSDPKI